MENKCFVTSFDAIVDDDNLMKFGEMRMYFPELSQPSLQQQSFAIMTSEDMTLTAIEGYFTDNSLTVQTSVVEMSITKNVWNNVFVSNGAVISIPNKYKITGFSMRGSGTPPSTPNKYINIDDLEFSSGLLYLNLRYSDSIGNLESLVGKPLADVDFRDTRVSGELASLNGGTFSSLFLSGRGEFKLTKPLAQLNSLINISCQSDLMVGDIANTNAITSLETVSITGATNKGGKMYGNIGSLGSLINLTKIEFSNNPNIVGDVEDMLDTMYNSGSGRTSGTLKINCGNTGIKYNGSTIPDSLTVTFSAGGWSV